LDLPTSSASFPDAMKIDPIHPQGWAPAKGYSNGMLVRGDCDLLFVAGQIAWDAQQRLVGPGDFVAQFGQALGNVIAVVKAAGGFPGDIARLTLYVTDKQLYLKDLRAIGAAYREHLGRHYPAMALVEVADLLETGALVEIEATAAIKRM
jgi:enamine deaminase RidA (YjgF/YER057c/UK114 family)